MEIFSIIEDLNRNEDLLKGDLEETNHNLEIKEKENNEEVTGHKTLVFYFLEQGDQVSIGISNDVKNTLLMNEKV